MDISEVEVKIKKWAISLHLMVVLKITLDINIIKTAILLIMENENQ